jgi:beta-lactamase class A
MTATAESITTEIDELGKRYRANAVAVGFVDFGDKHDIWHNADRWFHAASTIKLALLVGVYAGISRGDLVPHSRVHVRNRFHSALDGTPFRVAPERDSNSAVHAALGKTLTLRELAFHMIATSSNLATNLLLDLLGVESARKTLHDLGVDGGIELRRGVEDERAFGRGINNRVTARGLTRLMEQICSARTLREELCAELLDILLAQQFNTGIPAGLPREARVAHKTGEISTVAHDSGIIYLPSRRPYALTILTEWEPDVGDRSEAIAGISRLVYEYATS